eukprot:CAMPEP_0179152818 /NCGR_PEP_ID=MMETSP0796-20121207/74277_1 /TAXON_ID=73915 /ORGANISM="Pyrodinium bahamense, Strain pbaha01" /LENGTH=343 /DNA_ID=CAMNT_0020854043 /DNA_START=125 /DNA_END=1156 /DNA_ORIENTATION=-
MPLHWQEMQFRLLIPSDVHDDVDALAQLAAEVAHEQVDAILCPGDLSTMPNEVPLGGAGWVEPSIAEVAKYSDQACAVIAALRQVRPSARLVFVPGNHDPYGLFTEEAFHFDTHAENVHGRVAHLAPGLVVAGWGGSPEGLEDGAEVWSAYPWRDAEMADAGLSRLAHQVADLPHELPEPTHVVLLTHPGPASSSTTRVTGTDPNSLHEPGIREHAVHSGSAAVEAALDAPAPMQARVVLHLHGHTHHGCGLARLGRIPVLNPGSLCYTRTYALATLSRRKVGTGRKASMQWRLTSFDIRTLGEPSPVTASSWAPLQGLAVVAAAAAVWVVLGHMQRGKSGRA